MSDTVRFRSIIVTRVDAEYPDEWTGHPWNFETSERAVLIGRGSVRRLGLEKIRVLNLDAELDHRFDLCIIPGWKLGTPTVRGALDRAFRPSVPEAVRAWIHVGGGFSISREWVDGLMEPCPQADGYRRFLETAQSYSSTNDPDFAKALQTIARCVADDQWEGYDSAIDTIRSVKSFKTSDQRSKAAHAMIKTLTAPLMMANGLRTRAEGFAAGLETVSIPENPDDMRCRIVHLWYRAVGLWFFNQDDQWIEVDTPPYDGCEQSQAAPSLCETLQLAPNASPAWEPWRRVVARCGLTFDTIRSAYRPAPYCFFWSYAERLDRAVALFQTAGTVTTEVVEVLETISFTTFCEQFDALEHALTELAAAERQ
ncbi:MAG: hypothetical protein AAGC55_05740 [Myxococcota bacterium]